MFFEIASGAIRATHEWMSLVFVFAAGFHIYTNKRPFARYFANKTKFIIAASVVAGGMLYTLSFDDIYLAEASFQLLTRINIGQLSPILEVSHDEMLNKLYELGITVVTPGQSLQDIALAYGLDVHEVLELLIEP